MAYCMLEKKYFKRGMRENMVYDIFESCYQEYIAGRFLLASYTFDVVRLKKDRVKLVDFNPFGEVTDGIFFHWDELLNNNFR